MAIDLTPLIENYGSPVFHGSVAVFTANAVPARTVIRSSGTDNVLVLAGGTDAGDIDIDFRASRSCVFLGPVNSRLRVVCGHGCKLVLEEGTTFTTAASFMLAEEKNIYVGRDCMFAENVSVSNTDGHPIFDLAGRRLNHGRDVVIGHHVWIGRGVEILKGAYLDSGAVIGARSVVSGRLAGRAVYAGNPARQVRSDVIFSRATTVRRALTDCPPEERVPPEAVDPGQSRALALIRQVFPEKTEGSSA